MLNLDGFDASKRQCFLRNQLKKTDNRPKKEY